MSVSSSINNSINSKNSIKNEDNPKNQSQNELETLIKSSKIEPHTSFHNNKIINTLRSQQSLNTEEVNYLPYMLLEMQEALTKSNSNIINLKSTIDNLLLTNKETTSKLTLSIKKYKRLKEKYFEMKYKSIELNQKLKEEKKNLLKKDVFKKEMIEIEEMKVGLVSIKHELERVVQENEYMKEHLKEKELRNIENVRKYDVLNEKYISIMNDKSGFDLKINSIYEEIKEKERKYKYLIQDSQRKDMKIEELEKVIVKSMIENQGLRVELNLQKKLVLNLIENILLISNDSMNLNKVLEEISDDIGYKEVNIEEVISKAENQIRIYKKNYPSSIEGNEKDEKDFISVVEYIEILKNISNISIKFSNDMKEIISDNEKLTQRLKEEVELKNKIKEKYFSIRGNLRIMARIRPSLYNESSVRSFVVKENEVISTADLKKEYCFDKVYNINTSTKEMLTEITPLISSVLKGRNSCLISYGATGTGKTYTLQGNKESKGLVYLIGNEIFNKSTEIISDSMLDTKKYSLSMSMIEVYNDSIYNLITNKETNHSLNIYENSEGSLIIPELNIVEVNNIDECEKLIRIVKKLRQTSNNSFNERSSRSHCIITFYLKQSSSNGSTVKSRFNIIDLAGSERLSKCNFPIENTQKQEVSFINSSLNALSNVLFALASSQNHVPYRDSKLTHFLKESFSEGYNLLLLLHVSPTYEEILESISTLEFGSRLGRLSKFRITLFD